jgi:uncharacterized RDD family membrane protein YckC
MSESQPPVFEPAPRRERTPRPGGSRLLVRRGGAMAIDWLLALVLAAGLGGLGGALGLWAKGVDGSYGTLTDQLLLLGCVALVTLPLAIRSGQTPGKRLAGLQTSTHEPARLAAREALKYLPLSIVVMQPAAVIVLLYYPIAFAMAWRRTGWSLHDLAAGTEVARATRKNQASAGPVE